MKEQRVSPIIQELIKAGYLTPEAKNKPVANFISVTKEDYEKLLSKFPEQYRWKLRAYTGEELYYIYRICTYKPRLDAQGCLTNSSDGFILAQKTRCFKWLKGELKSGINTAVLNRIGRKFRQGFHDIVVESITEAENKAKQEQIVRFKEAMNAKRVG